MGVILAPDGTEAVPIEDLTEQEYQLLTAYKRFLNQRKLREALYCNHCWEGNLSDGTAAHVTTHEAVIRCRCRILRHRATT